MQHATCGLRLRLPAAAPPVCSTSSHARRACTGWCCTGPRHRAASLRSQQRSRAAVVQIAAPAAMWRCMRQTIAAVCTGGSAGNSGGGHPARQSSSCRRRCQHRRAFWRAVAVPACASRSGGGGGAGSRLSPPPPRASGRLRTSCNAHCCHVKRIQHSGMQMTPPRASVRLRATVSVRAPQAAAQTAIRAYDLRITPTECCATKHSICTADERQQRPLHGAADSVDVLCTRDRFGQSSRRLDAQLQAYSAVLTYLHVWWPPASYFPPQS
jgi:hypothetical protein